MPDMRGFSATLASDWRGLSTFAPGALFLTLAQALFVEDGVRSIRQVSKTVNSNVLLAIMKAHADGIDVLRRGDADPRCVLGVTVAKAQAPRFLPRPPQGARLGLLLAAFSPGEARDQPSGVRG